MSLSFVRRHLTTIVLVILAVTGTVVLFVTDKGSVTTDEADLRKKNLVPAWRLEEIRAVTLTTHGKTAKLVLGAPTAAGQRLWDVEIDGAKFLASQQSVDTLLGTLEYATFERRVSKDAVSEGELGLAQPITSVTIEMGTKTFRIKVGGVAPTPKDARYCDVDGAVYVITAQLAAALDMRPEALRTRTFVPYLSTELASLSVDGEGGARHFARAAWSGSRGAGFRFDGSTPEGTVRANAEAIDQVLGALGGLQAETFLADEDADKALQKKVTLTMAPKDQQKPKAVIEVGGACPGKEDLIVAVRREPSRTSACVPASVMEALTRPASEFVDLSVIGARPDEIDEVTIEEGPRALELARLGTGWHMRKPADRKVGTDPGKAFADALTGLDATKIVSGAPKDLGLDPPAARVKVTSAVPTFGGGGGSTTRVETIEVGKPDGGVVRVRRLEDDVILEVPADKASALTPSEVTLRDADVLTIARDQLRELSVTTQAAVGARAQRVMKSGAAWTLAEPKIEGIGADSGLVEDIADALVGLKAVRWVAPKDDGSFGLAKPRVVIEAKVFEEEGKPLKSVRVEIGGEASDGVFARTSDDPAVFVAPPAIVQAASAWLLDRQALVVDPAAIARVEVSVPGGGWSLDPVNPGGAGSSRMAGKKLVAERAGDAWKLTSGEGPDAAATLRNTVAGLIADRVVSIGAPERAQGFDKPRLVLVVVADPEMGAPKTAAKRTLKIAFGAGDSVDGTSVVYARREGLDATFAIPQGKVRALFDVAGVK